MYNWHKVRTVSALSYCTILFDTRCRKSKRAANRDFFLIFKCPQGSGFNGFSAVKGFGMSPLKSTPFGTHHGGVRESIPLFTSMRASVNMAGVRMQMRRRSSAKRCV